MEREVFAEMLRLYVIGVHEALTNIKGFDFKQIFVFEKTLIMLKCYLFYGIIIVKEDSNYTLIGDETMAEKDLHIMYNYAFCGTPEGFNGMLQYLSELAESEVWSFSGNEPNSILKKYILGTFNQFSKQNKILVSEDGQFSCFNTGLLTGNGNDIVGLFEKNDRSNVQPWFFKGFKDKCHRDFLDVFYTVPELATYATDFRQLYFNPNYNIVVNTDHILDDNWERIHDIINFDKNVVKALLVGAIEDAKLKIKRNLRLVVPQFYRDEIMYLVPIKIPTNDGSYVVMALAVEKTETEQYRANTIFTKEMAYEKARLLMKPESNWLME